jgi:hypothetical protein
MFDFVIDQADLRYELYGNFEVHESPGSYSGICRACRNIVVTMPKAPDVVDAAPLVSACMHLESCTGMMPRGFVRFLVPPDQRPGDRRQTSV